MSKNEQPLDLTSLDDAYDLVAELDPLTVAGTRRADGAEVLVTVTRAPAGDARHALAHLAADTQLLASRTHRHLVPVLDGRWVGDDAFAVVRRRLAAPTVAELVARGEPLTMPRIAAILREVNGLLEWARAQKVVHREITPATIYLEPDTDRVLAAFTLRPIRAAGAGDAEEDDARNVAELAWAMITGGAAGAAHEGPRTAAALRELRPDVSEAVAERLEELLRPARTGSEPPDARGFIAMIAMNDALRDGETDVAQLVSEQRARREAWEAERREHDERAAEEVRLFAEKREELERALVEKEQELERQAAAEREELQRAIAAEREELQRTIATEREELQREREELQRAAAAEREQMQRTLAEERQKLERAFAEEREAMERTLASERAQLAAERQRLEAQRVALAEERAAQERMLVETREELSIEREEQERRIAQAREELQRERQEEERRRLEEQKAREARELREREAREREARERDARERDARPALGAMDALPLTSEIVPGIVPVIADVAPAREEIEPAPLHAQRAPTQPEATALPEDTELPESEAEVPIVPVVTGPVLGAAMPDTDLPDDERVLPVAAADGTGDAGGAGTAGAEDAKVRGTASRWVVPGAALAIVAIVVASAFGIGSHDRARSAPQAVPAATQHPANHVVVDSAAGAVVPPVQPSPAPSESTPSVADSAARADSIARPATQTSDAAAPPSAPAHRESSVNDVARRAAIDRLEPRRVSTRQTTAPATAAADAPASEPGAEPARGAAPAESQGPTPPPAPAATRDSTPVRSLPQIAVPKVQILPLTPGTSQTQPGQSGSPPPARPDSVP